MSKSIVEISAGGVVYKIQVTSNKEQEIKFLIGLHSGYHKWVLPKGRLENEETTKQAALREVEEETGIVAKIVLDTPIHVEKYSYKAELQSTPLRQGFEGQARNKLQETNNNQIKNFKQEPIRRVAVYQENAEFNQQSADLVEVDKTVEFFLMEYVSGNVDDRDWEMSQAKWLNYQKALELLAFDGEKMALTKAQEYINKNTLKSSVI